MEGNHRKPLSSQEQETTFINFTESDAAAGQRGTPPSSDATQRVFLDDSAPAAHRNPPTTPQRTSGANTRPATTQAQRRAPAKHQKKKAWYQKLPFKLDDKVTIITLCCIAAVLLIAVIITLCVMFASPSDDGLILSNVYAAGVNLGGKTPEAAKLALQEATADTYTQLDMVIEVHDSTLVLTPADTGAKLDVDAVVDAAYNYGRTGSRSERQKAKNQAATSSYTISVIPYLSLDTEYIQEQVEELGSMYSTTLSQPDYRVEGTRPDLNADPNTIDVTTVYQTLYITVGTAEYGLDTDKLYDQILEAYNTNIFQVVGEMTIVTPDALDLTAVYNALCIDPVDAALDEVTFEVTPESYGYGFNINAVQELLSKAEYGEEIEVPLTYLSPNVTEEMLTEGLFEKIIATYTTPATSDSDLIANLKLACKEFPEEGLILKVDEEFSFNDLIGSTSEAKGYREVADAAGNMVMGGGVSRLSSALYYCALMSDMKIQERSSHTYAPSFIEPGLDADVSHGSKDLCFQNTTGRPVRIEVTVSGNGAVKVDIWGTANNEYTVEIVYETVNTYKPATLTNMMTKDNPGGYKAGDVLQDPITGYDVCTYRVYRYSSTSQTSKELVDVSSYAKQDKVVVGIQKDPEPTQPTDPEETKESTGKDETTKPTDTEDDTAKAANGKS